MGGRGGLGGVVEETDPWEDGTTPRLRKEVKEYLGSLSLLCLSHYKSSVITIVTITIGEQKQYDE